jgi:hypothetical protein
MAPYSWGCTLRVALRKPLVLITLILALLFGAYVAAGF